MPRTVGTTAEDTRARILDVALELVTERGYAGTSIRDLAERLHLTTAAIYYHFASKEALLDALVAPLTGGLDELAAAAGTGQLSDRELLTRLVGLLTGPAARALPVLMSDPSASRQLRTRMAPLAVVESIVRDLAGSDDQLDLLRASCAVAVVHGAVIRSALDHRRGVRWTGFEPDEASVVVGAALAALHSQPAPGP